MTLSDYVAAARELLAATKKGDAEARKRMRVYLAPMATAFSPTMAKYVIAREAGYTGWPALRQALVMRKEPQNPKGESQ